MSVLYDNVQMDLFSKQPGIQKFVNFCGHRQDIYNFLYIITSFLVKPVVYSNTAVYGGH